MADQQGTPPQSFPRLSQRELVGLALHRGCRRPQPPPAGGPAATQRDRVRAALALGLGGPGSSARAARRTGVYR
jgi:hypothetical protein